MVIGGLSKIKNNMHSNPQCTAPPTVLECVHVQYRDQSFSQVAREPTAFSTATTPRMAITTKRFEAGEEK